jgi:hypothetical protein
MEDDDSIIEFMRKEYNINNNEPRSENMNIITDIQNTTMAMDNDIARAMDSDIARAMDNDIARAMDNDIARAMDSDIARALEIGIPDESETESVDLADPDASPIKGMRYEKNNGEGVEGNIGNGSTVTESKSISVVNTTPTRNLPDWMIPSEVLQTRDDVKLKERRNVKSQLKTQAEDNSTDIVTKYPYMDIYNIEDIVHGRIICFDLETTGFSNDDCILEIGAVELIDGYRTGVIFQSFAQPQKCT